MGQKAVTRNRIGNPAQHSDAWATTEGTCQSSSEPTSHLRFGWVQNGHGGGAGHEPTQGGGLASSVSVHPTILPAKSVVLNVAANGRQERGNPPHPLHDGVAGRAYVGGGKDESESQCLRESR